jgi:hypothetical protein
MTTSTTKTAKPAKTVDDHAVGTGAAEGEAATTAAKGETGGTKGKAAKTPATSRNARQRPAVAADEAKTARQPRTDTKQAKLIAMLEAKDGTTIEEVANALGWQAHTVRGAIYGALRKKLGLDVTSEKVEGRGRVYRIGN